MRQQKMLWVTLGLMLCLAVGLGGLAQAGVAASRGAAPANAAAAPAAPALAGGWRSGGPYGGNVQALALSPEFRTDGFALAGGWRQGHYGPTGGYGIARTSDGGATWQLLQDEQHRWPVFDLALSPDFANDDTAYAGTEVGLLRSTDRGENWLTLWGGLPGCEKGSVCGITRVRLSPDFAADGLMLALPRAPAGSAIPLYRSTDRGDSWTPVLTGGIVFAMAFSRDFAINQTVYAVKMEGADAVFVLRSTDAGVTWSQVWATASLAVADILETVEGTLLLATSDGVKRLIPEGDGFVEEAAAPNIPGQVNRLITGGDNQYAAAEDGLYISMSFGRTWERYDATPQTPFRAVAWGGGGRALLAGTHSGLIFTPDDNLQPWRWLAGPRPVDVRSVAASPAWDADGTLFAGADVGIFRSTDRGASWQLVATNAQPGDDFTFPAVRISPGYATDGTVFAVLENRTFAQTALYKSTDRGETWTVFSGTAGSRALALSPNYLVDQTVFVACANQLYKSTDGGLSWTTYPIAVPDDGFIAHDLKVSPAYASDRTLFVTGFGQTRRSTDGGATWVALNSAAPGYGLAISPGYAVDRTVWQTYRAIESAGDGTPDSGVVRTTDRGATWQLATAGLPGGYEPFPIPLAVSPNYAADKTLFTALTGQFVAGERHSLYQALNGGDWWVEIGPAPGNPDVRDLAATALGVGGLTTSAHVATAAGVWHYDAVCTERLANGGFEVRDPSTWQMPATPATASYSTRHAHTGQQSLRTGIDGGADVYSYSSANQYFTIPAGAQDAMLRFWWYPISGETAAVLAEEPAAAALQAAARAALGQAEAVGADPDAVLSSDRQYVLLLNASGQILKTLLWTRSNASAWQQLTFDLTAYRGRTLRLAFGTYNDGRDGATAMYVDDVSLTTCWPMPPAPTPTPTVTPTRRPILPVSWLPLVSHFYSPVQPPSVTPTRTPTASPTVTRTATRTPTATATPTATSTPEVLADRWLCNLVVAPGATGRLLGITNWGHLVSSADRGGTWSYLALPPALGGGLEGNTYVSIDYNHPDTLYLGAGTQGLWRSTDGGLSWEKRHPIYTGPVAVGLDDPQVLWIGTFDPAYFPLARSTDGGLTWSSTEPRTEREAISPILIDPVARNLVFTVTMNRRGTASLERSFDSIWESIPAPVYPIFPVINKPYPSRGLALDSGTRGLYVGNPNGTLYVSHNAFALNKDDVTWQPVHSFGFQPSPLAVGAGPSGSALYVTINVNPWNCGQPGRTLRSDDGGQTWLPLTIPPPPGPTPTPTATPTATPVSPVVTPVACYEGLVNGGFETSAGWTIRSNPVLAAYVTSPVHGGARSMRTGIAAGGANVLSYSPIEQAISLPAALNSARLTFWRYNVNGDVAAAGVAAARAPLPASLPRTEVELNAAAQQPFGSDAADFFYAIVIRADGSIDWLLSESVNRASWRQATVDLSRYRGQTIRLQFGTYNNGSLGVSRTYVDDVSLEICPPGGALVLPAGWAQRVIGRPEADTLYAAVNGMLYRSDDAGGSWRVSGTARPEQMLLSADPNVLYAGDGYPCYAGGPDVPMWRSIDGGATWQQLPAGKNLKPLAVHPADRRLYAAGCDGPYLSTDAGGSFTHQPDPLFGLYDARFLAPMGEAWTTVWAGGISEGGGGAVLRSADSGATWAQSTPLGLNMGWLGDLALDRFAPGRVYAPAVHGFFVTLDDGLTWSENSAGLADVVDPGTADRSYGLLALAQPPGDFGRRLFLGTVRGLYSRDPDTLLWYKITGLAYDGWEVRDLLALDGAADDLYVTTANGVFIYDLRVTPPAPTATPTATPVVSPTPTATATPGSAIPTAPAGAWPTPRVLATLNLPAGSRPHGVAVSSSGDRAYIAFHGIDHSGRDLGVVDTDPLALLQTVQLNANPAGPNGVALVPLGMPMGYVVAVTNRQTDELVLVDPASTAIHRRFNTGDMPDGVIQQGRYYYAANYGSDSVTIFAMSSLDPVRTVGVGHEPALFAADPVTNDVFLSLHGADKVARLHDDYVAQEFADIPEPYGLAFDPVSRRLYVANRGAHHTVTVLDLTTGASAGAIDVGQEPYVVAVNPDTGHLFVACGDKVKVYRTLDWALVAAIPVPAGAEEGIAVDSVLDRVYVTSRDADALTVIQDAAPPLVLFTSDRDGNTELYRMLPDGRQQQRLTTSLTAGETDATGSPDGRWIAYTRTQSDSTAHLWLMSRDGRNARRLDTGMDQNDDPTWSPDGTQLAFAAYIGGNWDIYTLRLADGVLSRLTVDAAADTAPDWSWANNRIAFQSNRGGPNAELYTMAADGSDVRRLTVNANGDTQPSWNPAGDRLAFWGTRAEQTIYRINADGTGIVPLVPRAVRPGRPEWSPNGSQEWLAFTGYRPDSGHSEVLRIEPDGTDMVLLTLNEVDFDAATGWLPGAGW